jgi:hypothetical protein
MLWKLLRQARSSDFPLPTVVIQLLLPLLVPTYVCPRARLPQRIAVTSEKQGPSHGWHCFLDTMLSEQHEYVCLNLR